MVTANSFCLGIFKLRLVPTINTGAHLQSGANCLECVKSPYLTRDIEDRSTYSHFSRFLDRRVKEIVLVTFCFPHVLKRLNSKEDNRKKTLNFSAEAH